jgi:hypothetical protein
MSQFEYKSVTIGHGKGKGTAPKTSGSSSGDTNASELPAHVRALSAFIARGRKARGLLAHGAVLDILTHDNTSVVASLPLALFNALSSSNDIVDITSGNPHITLPPSVLHVSVKDLVSRLIPFSDPATTIAPMSPTGDLFKDLHIASAAESLGLTLYTQSMFNTHFARFKAGVPSPADLDAISKIDTPLGNKLFASVTLDLATLYWHNNLPNDSAFEAYCEQNTRVGDAVAKLCRQWVAADNAAAVREERRVWRAKQKAEFEAKAAEQQAVIKARAAEQQLKFEAKAAATAQLGHVVRGKMRVKGSTYTAAEARYIWATFGKRVPVQMGG